MKKIIIAGMVVAVSIVTRWSQAQSLDSAFNSADKIAVTNAHAKPAVKTSAWKGLPVLAALNGCSVSTRRAFLENMVFVDGKLAGTRVKEAKECLGEQGLKNVLAFFNTKPTADHDRYKCSSRGTCSSSVSDICTSNCRGGDTLTVSYFSMSDVLKDYPQAERDQIVDSLVFTEGGQLVSASPKLLKVVATSSHR